MSVEGFNLPDLAPGLLPAPPPALDPYLDAAARCFTRHGIGRTNVQDIAREVGVNRTTVYRQVGGIENLARLLLARELHRVLAQIAHRLPRDMGAEGITRLVAELIGAAREHPVLAKVLADEPELIGPFLVTDFPAMADRVIGLLRPILEDAISRGEIADRDPRVLAEWLVRVGASVLIDPPRGDLHTFLAEILLPALTPAK